MGLPGSRATTRHFVLPRERTPSGKIIPSLINISIKALNTTSFFEVIMTSISPESRAPRLKLPTISKRESALALALAVLNAPANTS